MAMGQLHYHGRVDLQSAWDLSSWPVAKWDGWWDRPRWERESIEHCEWRRILAVYAERVRRSLRCLEEILREDLPADRAKTVELKTLHCLLGPWIEQALRRAAGNLSSEGDLFPWRDQLREAYELLLGPLFGIEQPEEERLWYWRQRQWEYFQEYADGRVLDEEPEPLPDEPPQDLAAAWRAVQEKLRTAGSLR